MTGGNDNGCLQVFIARYTKSANATSLFKDALDKYVYLATTIQGFCYPMIGRDTGTKEKYLGKTKAVVKAIRMGMSQKLAGLKLNDSDPWTCEKQRTLPTVSPFGSTTLSTTKASTSASATDPDNTTTMAPMARATCIEVKKFVTDELDNADKEFATKAWVSRIDSYGKMITSAVGNVRNKYIESLKGRGSVEGIMFLPYGKDDDGQQCMNASKDNDGNHTEEHRYNGADFFVRFTYNIDGAGLSRVMDKIRESKNALLDAAFSPKGGNLCKRLMDAIGGFKSSEKVTAVGKGSFSAVAAVKCGRQFVWYQLGYRYFAAAGVSNEGYVITSGSVDSYNANCGQIMFFP